MKIEKHEKIAKLAVSALNTISSRISKTSDDSISNEEFSLMLLKFETFTRKKEDIREKSKTSLEKTGNIQSEANELLHRNKIGVPTSVHVQNHVQNHFQNRVQNHFQIRVRNHVQNHVQNRVQKIKI